MEKLNKVIAVVITICIVLNVFSIRSYGENEEENPNPNSGSESENSNENSGESDESDDENGNENNGESNSGQEESTSSQENYSEETTSNVKTDTNRTSNAEKSTNLEGSKTDIKTIEKDVVLKTLTITGYEIVFDANKTEYSIEIPNEENSIEVKAKADKANVNVSETNNLQVGENNVKVTVTSESGNTKEYNIKVTRKDEIPVVTIDKLDKAIKNTTKDTITLIIDNVEITDAIFGKIKDSGKNYIFESIKDNVIQYEWTISSENLNKLTGLVPKIEISELTLKKEYNYSETYNITFNSDYKINSELKIFVGNMFENDDEVYVYANKSKIENLSKVEVKDGYIQIALKDTDNPILSRANLTNKTTRTSKSDTSKSIPMYARGLILAVVVESIIIVAVIIYIIRIRNMEL